MNPLTLVKRIQKLNSREADLGISEDASWHAKYKDSAYVFVGGIPYDLTEGDLLAIFAQYGEIVDVNLVRDKATGKSKGFAFIAYEDQRSTNLAVDNLNGAQVLGRTIRVDHVSHYKKKEEEDEETERQKREERGVCRAFQRGECTRGAGCKFSHDEQRAANTGWGHEEDKRERWGHDKFQRGGKPEKRSVDIPPSRDRESGASERRKADELDAGRSRIRGDLESYHKHHESEAAKDRDGRDRSGQLEDREKMYQKEDRHSRGADKRSSRSVGESYAGKEYDRREDKRPRQHDREQYNQREGRDERERESRYERERERRSSHARDSSSLHHRNRDDDDHHKSRR